MTDIIIRGVNYEVGFEVFTAMVMKSSEDGGDIYLRISTDYTTLYRYQLDYYCYFLFVEALCYKPGGRGFESR
jgi:hypothetical protein